MKNLKSFVARNPLLLALVMLGLFLISFLSVLEKPTPLSAFFCSLMGVLFLVPLGVGWNMCFNYKWVCTKCSEMEIFSRHKFCSVCGGIMHAIKKEKILCPRGHEVAKNDKFCSKCGTSLNG